MICVCVLCPDIIYMPTTATYNVHTAIACTHTNAHTHMYAQRETRYVYIRIYTCNHHHTVLYSTCWSVHLQLCAH